jgi:hypothetical protein
MADDSEWTGLAAPPPPIFTGAKEREFVDQVNTELIENIIGQRVIYYPIDLENTYFHPIYGEASLKTFLHPVIVNCLVLWEGMETEMMDSVGLDKKSRLEVRFHKRRLNDDVNLFVRDGDFVKWGDTFYEIVRTGLPKELWGQPSRKFEIVAFCTKAREGTFDAT